MRHVHVAHGCRIRANGVKSSVAPQWYVACLSRDLNPGPVRSVIAGIPLALFRSRQGVVALLDRCPHRNAPLSAGQVKGDELECEYHGWRFSAAGECVFAAGVPPEQINRACHATSYPATEQKGLVWVSSAAGERPSNPPFTFDLADRPGYSTVITVLEAEGSLHAVAENALDVPHTMYLHGGLFRKKGGGRMEREVEIRNFGDRVEAEYFDEERPAGIAGRLLAPGGGRVRHVDRFILPSITEVDYRLGDKTHVNVSVAMTPVGDYMTRLYAVVSMRLSGIASLARPLLKPLFLRIFRQDAEVLSRQSANIRAFGGERFATTVADVLGPAIARLLKSLETDGEVRTLKVPQIRRTRILI